MDKKRATSLLGILFVLVVSLYVVNNYDVSNIKIVDNEFILTYLGIFLGFAITIYTFGVSMLENIKININQKEDLDPKTKAKFFRKLLNGFKELKIDIWLIFYCFLAVVIFSISKFIPVISFLESVEIIDGYPFKIRESINLTIFILSLWAIFDLMKALFSVSEITFQLIISDIEDDVEDELKL